MRNIVDNLMPKREIVLHSKYNGWFNDRVLDALKRRDQSYKQYKLTNNQNDWEMYKRDRNEVTSIIRTEKCRHFQEKIDSCQGNSKEMWKSLKNITGQKTRGNIDVVDFNGKVVHNLNEIVEKFNEFLVQSVEDIIETIPINNRKFPVKNSNYALSDFKLLKKCELKEIIFSLANKSSPDDVGMFIYKEFFDVLADTLINVINCSLLTGKVPDSLKVSTIILLRKVAKTIKAEEFRPINMLPAFEKILEKVVYLQILEYVSNNRLICKYQSGFRKNHSCESALQYVINDWKEALDEGKVTAIIFLDLKRAFETIDRAKLLEKLKALGFKGIVLNWVKDYMNNRRQKVKYEEYVSRESHINVGIPQGSILGPLLFILYLNDISLIFETAKYHLFADDTIIYMSDTCILNLIAKLNQMLENVSDWMEVNKLKLNVAKTKGMILGKKSYREIFLTNRLQLKLCGEIVEIVNEIKYLGIIIDNDLKFNKNIDYICKKVAKKIGVLCRVSWYLSIKTRKLVYNTIILPHFCYCSTVLYLANQESIGRLQKLQNRAMRTILGCNRYTRVDDMLETLGWLNIQQFLEYNVLVFIHKIRLGEEPEYLQNILKTFENVHDYDTRGRQNFVLQRVRTTAGQNSIFFKGISKYNSLNQAEKDTRSIISFRRLLKDSYIL